MYWTSFSFFFNVDETTSWRNTKMFPWKTRHAYPLYFPSFAAAIRRAACPVPYFLVAQTRLYLLSLILNPNWPIFLFPSVQYLHHYNVYPPTTWVYLHLSWKWKQQVPLNCWYPSTSLHIIANQDHDLNFYNHVNLKSREDKTTYISLCRPHTADYMQSRLLYVALACCYTINLSLSLAGGTQHMVKSPISSFSDFPLNCMDTSLANITSSMEEIPPQKWRLIYEISSSHGGEYEVQICLLGCIAI
jgi:hypothetical protein